MVPLHLLCKDRCNLTFLVMWTLLVPAWASHDTDTTINCTIAFIKSNEVQHDFLVMIPLP